MHKTRKPPRRQARQARSRGLFDFGLLDGIAARVPSPIVCLALLAVLLGGCAGFPRDQHGTTARIRESGVLSVGASATDVAPTVLEEREQQLVDRVAERLGADAQWRHGNTHELLDELEAQQLALVAATVPCDSPIGARIALSQPYLADGPHHTVYCLAVAPGENELLLLVDRVIADARGTEGKQ